MRRKDLILPFFCFNPKSYLYGEELLELAIEADYLAEKYELSVFITAPFADISLISRNTKNIIVTAQHIDPIKPGRGMGHVLPDSVINAGAKATFLNHAENPMTLESIVKAIQITKEMNILSIVCANSVDEAKLLATLNPDILLCEPTELIGTGTTSDNNYVKATTQAIKQVNSEVLIMQGAGISNERDVNNVLTLKADGTGCTSGIVKASNPKEMLKKMIIEASKFKKEG